MKTSALKLGNLVWFEGKIYPVYQNDLRIGVTGLGDLHSSVHSLEIDKKIKPVSIDSEGLIKLGFKIKKHVWSDNSVSDDLYWNGKFFIGIHEGYNTLSRLTYSGEQQYLTNVQYLHEIQNIYFSLIEKELTFKK